MQKESEEAMTPEREKEIREFIVWVTLLVNPLTGILATPNAQEQMLIDLLAETDRLREEVAVARKEYILLSLKHARLVDAARKWRSENQTALDLQGKGKA